MKVLSRYILWHLSLATSIVLAILTTVLWLSQALRFVDWIVNRGLPIKTFLYLSVLILPNFLAVILPISVFSAVLFTFSKLQSDSEIIVMRAAGIGHRPFILLVCLLAATVTLIGYGVNLYLMPTAYREFKDLQVKIRNSYTGILIQEGVFSPLEKGLTIFVREQSEKGDIHGVMVHDERNAEQPVTMIAERGAIVNSPDGPKILMIEGNRQELNRQDGRVNFLFFERYAIDIEQVSGEESTERQRNSMERFLSELLNPDPSLPPHTIGRYRSEAHHRLTSPLYTIAYALVALAALLVGDHSRRGQSSRVMIAILIAIALQVTSFGLTNLVMRNAATVPLIYAFPIVTWIFASWALISGQSCSRTAFFFTSGFR